ncbi:MAG TPA: hypothetical protein VFK97_00555, partial [Candidatus Saccharimonadales bacterium]|nr:hypothetical protein [Candidatus Saccharimonadales bacterium]
YMIQKVLSLSTAVAIVIVYLWSQLEPNAALFYLMSANLIVNIGLLGLSTGLLYLSFMTRFKTAFSYGLTIVGASACLLFGGVGLVAAGFNYGFYSWFGPLDFLLLAEAGVIAAICVLSYEHQPIKLKLARPVLPPSVYLLKPSLSLPRLHLPSLRQPSHRLIEYWSR